jgi:hypothetical protein
VEGEVRERWQQLCEQAAEERDTERLIALAAEINSLLAEKERRLQSHGARQNAGKKSA